MNFKFPALILSLASAFGVSYFAAKTILELGDLERMLSTELNVLIAALVATLVPLAIAWGGIWLVSEAKNTYSQIMRLLLMTIAAWGWLYIGLVVVGLMRLQ